MSYVLCWDICKKNAPRFHKGRDNREVEEGAFQPNHNSSALINIRFGWGRGNTEIGTYA